jgi:hypothetical protein
MAYLAYYCSAVVMAFAGRSTAAGMGVLDDLTQLSPLSGVAIIAYADWRVWIPIRNYLY